MSDFEINKGVGREVEFKGLRAQYLFIFAFGLLAVFVVFVIMYTAGIGQWVCIGFGVSAATAHTNNEYAKSPTAKSCNQARPVQQFYVYLNNS